MRISQVNIEGYRNFKKCKINFEDKTLIIGANEVGKSNLLYALRLLLDRNLSEFDLEPQDSDFHAHSEANEIRITIKFEDVKESCVLAKLKENVSDSSQLFLQYYASRDSQTGTRKYSLLAGSEENKLEEIQGRFYLKVLNIRFIGSNRELYSYIRKEKEFLLQEAKERRTEVEISEDNTKFSKIKTDLSSINKEIGNLAFIKGATKSLNKELSDLSIQNENNEIIFDAGSADPSRFVENIHLARNVDGKLLDIGGDGRNNQIFLALWAAKNEIREDNPSEVAIYCIEEPEAHLHPHQQRKLSEYLTRKLKGQVILTSHSPQIAAEFSPNWLVRLHETNLETKAASEGCSKIIEDSLINFGYRLNILPAESFFAKFVFLVEGPSEILFYRALAKQIGLDLDKHNISILSVNGVDFETYIKMLNALEIPWTLRTDNDIYNYKDGKKKFKAGLSRAIKIYKTYIKDPETYESFLEAEKHIEEPDEKVSKENIIKITEILRKNGIFLSEIDLEHDLLNSQLKESLQLFFSNKNEDDLINLMQKKKAVFMYEFLFEKSESLKLIKDDKITYPLIYCEKSSGQK